MRFTSTAAIGFWMRPTIVTSASVIPPFAGLSCAAATPATNTEAKTAIRVRDVRVRRTQGFLICFSFATRLWRRGRRGLGGAGGGRPRDRFLRALLRLQIGLFLLRAIQELFGVVALAGGELASHLLVLRDLDDRFVGLSLLIHAGHVRRE